MLRRGLLIAGVALVQLIINITLGLVAAMPSNVEALPTGVTLRGLSAAGLTEQELSSLLDDSETINVPNKIILRDGQKTWTIDAESFGLNFDKQATLDQAFSGLSASGLDKALDVLRLQAKKREVALQFTYDKNRLQASLDNINQEVYIAPQPAALKYDQNGEVKVIPEKNGQMLDYEATVAAIIAAISTADEYTIDIAKMPLIPQNDVTMFKDINTELAFFSTTIENHQSRIENIQLAAKTLDQTIIAPGEVISFNSIVGPRTAEKGYRQAPIITRTGVEQGLGGGVCQLATTLYNSALLSGLGIVERAPHSISVSYVEEGYDATVAYDSIDLQLANNHKHPVLISVDIIEDKLIVRVLGNAGDQQDISLESRDYKTIAPAVTIKTDYSLPYGTSKEVQAGFAGSEVKVYRLIKSENGDREEYISHSVYPSINQVIVKGQIPKNRRK